MLHTQPLFHRLSTRIVYRVFPPRLSISINEFLLKLHFTPTPNISMKFKLAVVITVDEQHRFSIVYFKILYGLLTSLTY